MKDYPAIIFIICILYLGRGISPRGRGFPNRGRGTPRGGRGGSNGFRIDAGGDSAGNGTNKRKSFADE